uniref:Uncharacterized protein MANES_04G084500 n=1 Tax=Rhizophora mucronata TaxID=61149 RepID=A0A2P2LXQ9_RHIMU
MEHPLPLLLMALQPVCPVLSRDSHIPSPSEHGHVHNSVQPLIMYYHWYKYFQNHISCYPLTILFLFRFVLTQ